jgi:tetratricopeptide (TPR) repeat protein
VRKIRVFAASPGDVALEREALARVVDELNRTLGHAGDLVVELVRWETHTWPGFGDDAQDVINREVGPYDIFVGMMWKRLGTPTERAQSGTVEEFDRAFDRWTQRGVPHLMFYFSKAPVPPEPEEVEQLSAVFAFKRMLAAKGGLYWEYADVSEFEQQVREHLFRQITSSLNGDEAAPSPPDQSGAFDVPSLASVVSRGGALEELEALCAGSPIVAVEGLPGSGKTFLVADFLRRLRTASSTLWYDAVEGSTLDDAMTLLGAQVPFTGSSNLTRAKELVHHLGVNDGRLVIDDFQLASVASFTPLLQAASRHAPPVRLLLISRGYVDLPLMAAPAARLALGGLNPEQIAEMLRHRGLSECPDAWVQGLKTKVGGLPIAVTLFAAAVAEFGRDADELLAGTIVGETRLKRWFDDVLEGLPRDARRLLRYLSAAAGPFSRQVVRMACRQLDIAEPDQPFETLQRAHLVEDYSRRRWSVHQLISTFCQLELDADELESIHAAFGAFYLSRGADWPGQLLDDETFANRVTACRHLHMAMRHREAQNVLTRIVNTAKAHGHYDTFMRLCEPVLRSGPHDPWLDYHYAHCCFVLGRLSAAAVALRDIEPSGLFDDPKLRLSLARLEAEVLLAAGESARALDLLTRALASFDAGDGGPVWAQAIGVEARIRLQLGETDEVARIAAQLLARSQKERDVLGAAVGFAYLGYVQLVEQDPPGARKSFDESAERFRQQEHRRGLAWALSGLAEALIASRDKRRALPYVAEALRIRSDVAECTPDYLRFLERVRDQFDLRNSTSVVRDEISRVGQVLEREQAEWQRQRRYLSRASSSGRGAAGA